MSQMTDGVTLEVQGCSLPLRVRSLAGREGISNLFGFQVEFLTDSAETSELQGLLGQPATCTLIDSDGSPRYFQGIIGRLSLGQVVKSTRIARVEIVPKLWYLTRRADYRIFQGKTVPQVIDDVLQAAGLKSGDDYRLSLQGNYPAREYCVQYRETDFDFISRLMEHEGIFYVFEHSRDKHVMIIADRNGAFPPIAGTDTVRFRAGTLREDHVHAWEHRYETRSGKWTHRDYNFQNPSQELQSSSQSRANTDLELYDYPGGYEVRSDGDASATVRIEEQEAAIDVVGGASTVRTFTSGATFTLQDHAVASENAAYLITSVEHSAANPDVVADGGASDQDYQNRFTCIPASVPFRPVRVTPKPRVQGAQTAVVVGPSNEDIYVDEFGRVKVQFYWDRVGQRNENSSCWIRVAQPLAGKNWGAFFYPRIKQEVVVEFLEGDPDRPLIIGSVYNADQAVPYKLPDEKTKSGIKTRTSPDPQDASQSNELRFEDKQGVEEIYLHGQKDWTVLIENDTHQTVGNDLTLAVKHDRTETVDNDESITVGNNRTAEVKNDASMTIGGNSTEVVKSDWKLTINGNSAEQVDKEKDIKVGTKFYIECGSAKVTIEQSGAITIEGANLSVTMSGNTAIKSSGNVNVEANGNATVKASGPVTVKGATVAIN